MDIVQVYNLFPSQKDCIRHLEKVIWNGVPVCPYCNSKKQSKISKENRYHCNNCNTTYSVTVGTIFHKTKLDLQKWFLAIYLIINSGKNSSRQLSRDIKVTKDTAWRMLTQIEHSLIVKKSLMHEIIKDIEHFNSGLNILSGPLSNQMKSNTL